jgi:hypothetical protein|tara:strand:+ start:1008 stop:1568 length:561 start_codon:yes stop_codon:yes gene_type:complete
MSFPQTFRKSFERNLANYNYVDIANGLGYSTFYGLFTAVAGTYALIGNPLVCGGSVLPADRRLNAENRDFETSTFNLPRVVKGTAYISGEAVSDGTGTITTIVKHWDGNTETTIGGPSSTPNFKNGTNGVFIAIPLAETVFKKGDLIRVSMSVGDCGDGVHGFYIDPVSAHGLEPFKVLIPFKIDL